MGFSVSTAKTDITPTSAAPNPYLAGYGTDDGGRTAAGPTPYEPLWARAVVLWDEGHPHLLLVADILAFPAAMHAAALGRILALAGWGAGDVVLAATHTHNGPVLVDTLDPYMAYGIRDLSEIGPYTDWLEDQVVATAQAALAAPQTEVTLDCQVLAQTFAVNRVGFANTETDVPLLVARDAGGAPVAAVFGYGCHPVAAGMQALYDGDYPTGACSFIENSTDVFPLFVQGAGGDQNPRGAASWALRDQWGDSLGAAVVGGLAAVGRPLTGPLATATLDVAVPLDVDGSPGNLAAVRALYEDRLPNPLGHPPWYARHAEVMIEAIDAGQVSTQVPVTLQRWRLDGADPLQIVWASGELVGGYASVLRGSFGGAGAVWVGGYAGASVSYLPSAQYFPPHSTGGSYEGGWDTDAPGIAGGSMTVYNHLGHYVGGATGVEQTLLDGFTQLLA